MSYNFQDKMREDKANCDARRARGLSAGPNAKGWKVKRAPLTGLDAIEAYYYRFKKDIHYNAYLAVETELFAHEWEGL
jgi:hypothetical protein